MPFSDEQGSGTIFESFGCQISSKENDYDYNPFRGENYETFGFSRTTPHTNSGDVVNPQLTTEQLNALRGCWLFGIALSV